MPDNLVNPKEIIAPKLRTDAVIWGVYVFLIFISIVELYSASAHEVSEGHLFTPLIRHIVLLVIGLGIMLTLQRIPYERFFNWTYAFAAASVVCMIYTMIWGDYINGARRSFSVGLFSVQPAEMIKVSAALVIARVLCACQIKGRTDVETRGVVYVAVVVLLFGGLLIMQGLTNTILLMAISLSMMLVGGVGTKKFLIVLAIYAVIAGVFYEGKQIFASTNKDATAKTESLVIPGTNEVVPLEGSGNATHLRDGTWSNRIKRYLKTDKYNDTITSENAQEQYSYFAQAHGGVKGVMFGHSRETSRLPLAFSDYIFAIVVEEMGLWGGIFLLICYLTLLFRAGRIAMQCRTVFPALLVTGMAVFIVYQALFHMAIVTGLAPVSGQPLPLISKGGTSILITSMALGIMLSVSRYAARKGDKPVKKALDENIPEAVEVANPL